MNALLPNTGYIFNFERGAYHPDGKVKAQLSQAEIDAHNKALAQLEIEAMKQTGRAVLYLHFRADNSRGETRKPNSHPCGSSVATWRDGQPFISCWQVGTWEGSVKFNAYVTTGRHNIARTRKDVWFNFDGSRWHGVNIGDNDIVRCKRTKTKAAR